MKPSRHISSEINVFILLCILYLAVEKDKKSVNVKDTQNKLAINLAIAYAITKKANHKD